MSRMFWIVLALFVVADLAVIAIVARRFLRQPGGPGSLLGNRKAIDAAHAMVGDYLRVNYSGDPSMLPAVLGGLQPALRDLLRSQGIDPQPELIRTLIEVSAARHRIASAEQLREALATLT